MKQYRQWSAELATGTAATIAIKWNFLVVVIVRADAAAAWMEVKLKSIMMIASFYLWLTEQRENNYLNNNDDDAR